MASLHFWFKGLVVKRAITRDNTVTQSAISVQCPEHVWQSPSRVAWEGAGLTVSRRDISGWNLQAPPWRILRLRTRHGRDRFHTVSIFSLVAQRLHEGQHGNTSASDIPSNAFSFRTSPGKFGTRMERVPTARWDILPPRDAMTLRFLCDSSGYLVIRYSASRAAVRDRGIFSR